MKTATRAPLSVTPAGALDEARLHRILGYQLAQAAIVTYAVFERIAGAPLDLRPVEYTILALVSENPGVSPVQLSKALAVTRANITTWIDKLEQRGLAKREQNTSDRRGQHLRPTERGTALAAALTDTHVHARGRPPQPDAAAAQTLAQRHHRAGLERPKPRARIQIADQAVPGCTHIRERDALLEVDHALALQICPGFPLFETWITDTAAEVQVLQAAGL